MATTLPEPLTVEAFLAWDDGSDRRHELVAGRIVAMAPPSEAHGTIVVNIARAIGNALSPPCRVVGEAGILLPDRNDTYYQADLVVTCAPPEPGRHHVAEPVLIVEVLSPSTAVHDRGLKLDHYCRLPSVQENLLVGSEERRVQHWRRDGERCERCGRWQVQNLIGEAELPLTAVDVTLPLRAIYAETGL